MRPLQARASLTQPTPRVKRSWPPLAVLKELQHIPGVGPSIAVDLYDLQIRSVADLKGQSADALYKQLCVCAVATLIVACSTFFAVLFILPVQKNQTQHVYSGGSGKMQNESEDTQDITAFWRCPIGRAT